MKLDFAGHESGHDAGQDTAHESNHATAHGQHANAGERRCKSLLLAWTDPDSGDRLTARITGGEDLAHELAPHGFKLLSSDSTIVEASGGDRAEPRTQRGDVSVVSQASSRRVAARGSRATPPAKAG